MSSTFWENETFNMFSCHQNLAINSLIPWRKNNRFKFEWAFRNTRLLNGLIAARLVAERCRIHSSFFSSLYGKNVHSCFRQHILLLIRSDNCKVVASLFKNLLKLNSVPVCYYVLRVFLAFNLNVPRLTFFVINIVSKYLNHTAKAQ